MKLYFTIAGTNHYFGQDFMEKGMPVCLEKEPDNVHDREAIKVTMEGLGLVGYVANSPYTVLGESCSAGRLYDRIGDTAEGVILYVLDKGVLCTLKTEKKPENREPETREPEEKPETGEPLPW